MKNNTLKPIFYPGTHYIPSQAPSPQPPSAMVPVSQPATYTGKRRRDFSNILKCVILANLLCLIFCKSLTRLFGIFICSGSILWSFWASTFSSKFKCWRGFGGICLAMSGFPSLSLGKPTRFKWEVTLRISAGQDWNKPPAVQAEPDILWP